MSGTMRQSAFAARPCKSRNGSGQLSWVAPRSPSACLDSSSTPATGLAKRVFSGSKRQKISKAPVLISAGQSQRFCDAGLSFSSSM
eukprot:6300460-Alexandrium_andersonii.AAC.1